MSTGTQIEVVMPQMGVSVSEGTVTRWLKQPGDAVAQDEPLLEISTDKVDTEVPSPGEGVLQAILVQEGETVAVGSLLATIGAEVAAAPPVASVAPAAEPVRVVAQEAAPAEAPAEDEATDAVTGGRTFVSPVVARIAAQHNIDPGAIPGTGQGGRVTKKDILSFIDSGAQAAPAQAPAVAPPAAPVPVPAAAPPTSGAPAPPLAAGETEEPMTAMRRGVLEHMRRSLDISAHVTSAIEVDLSRIVTARAALKKEYERAHGVNPTYLSFIAKATLETIADWPWINGELRGEKIVTRNHVNLGIAVALDGGRGLIVPVLRNAQDLNLLGLARGIADIAERARTKKLLPDDVQGGTFTITNPGGFGTIHGTPIINQPQVAILGTYALVKRPWVVQDALGQDTIGIRPLMNLTLTYDHRLIDGAYGGGFMKDLRARLEGWE